MIYIARATKKLDKNGSQLLASLNTMISFLPASLRKRNLEVEQIADKSGDLFRQNCPPANFEACVEMKSEGEF